ncbi:hypothetical protein [Wansuia hejianensis]|uniref:Uncharacterized protein n=1 Tax=Wansuia hejianensis TaxID=2763667 RepID=A0A926EY16_9FIRM|nr:hypothetical protein [Wansuia hejianensis]MBC8590600.1 hypothetical protein [Wansuia hejianensis]
MIQVIDYKEVDNIISAGFKKHNFVVYGQIGNIEGFTKKQYLQALYEQCKAAIDYETDRFNQGLPNHLVSKEEGETFIPDHPKPTTLRIDFDNLSGVVLDQYGDVYSTNVEFTIEGTNRVRIEGNRVIEDEVEESEEYQIVAKYSDLVETQSRTVNVIYPDNIESLEQSIAELTLETAQNSMEIFNALSAVNTNNEINQATMMMELLNMIATLQGGE